MGVSVGMCLAAAAAMSGRDVGVGVLEGARDGAVCTLGTSRHLLEGGRQKIYNSITCGSHIACVGMAVG